MTERTEPHVEIGPEQIVLTDGLQPFMFQTAKGTLVAMAQLSVPPEYKFPEKNVFPSLPGWIVSRDKGKSWQRWTPKGVAPASPYEVLPLGPRFEGTAAELSDGTVMILEWIADGPLPDGTWTGNLWESRDDCETLQGPTAMTIRLPRAKIGYDDSGRPYTGITFHRSLLELPNGDLIAPVYCWFKEDTTPVEYQPKMSKFRCVLLRSGDRGRSWRYRSTIAADPTVGQEGFDEPVMIRLSGGAKAGRLICQMRTGRVGPLYQTHSDDDGATWSRPHALPFPGVDPDLVEMADGTLVCQASAVSLTLSRDQGETWGDPIRLPEAGNPGYGRSSYGSIREIEPGRLLVLYDVMSAGWTGTIRYVASREIRVAP